MRGPRVDGLLIELARERQAFLVALDALGDSGSGRAVMGDWDGRDLAFHVAFWTDHGAEALHLAATGQAAAFDYDPSNTDAMNAATADAGRALTLAEARNAEAAGFERLRAALAAIDDETLDLALGNGDTVEDVIRYDGPDHYAEHAAQLRMPHG